MTGLRAAILSRILRKIPLIIAVFLFGWAGRFVLVDHHGGTTAKVADIPRAIVPADTHTPSAEADKPAPAPAPPPTMAAAFPESTMRQTVFRLQLDHNRCTLENVEEVAGAFGRERGMPWRAGMLCCRLLAGDGRIVSERTMPAPDQVCVVLDPNDASGTPTAAHLTSDGPAVFQVRFPESSGAERLEVYRISTETRPADAAAPVGQLLASIAIPVK